MPVEAMQPGVKERQLVNKTISEAVRVKTIQTVLGLLALLLVISSCSQDVQYDLVIANGRVIDPETQLDAIRHLGISDGSIRQISQQPLQGHKAIDASGLVVAPGFIDIHSHTPTLLGQKVNLLDGITTQLDLEAVSFPVSFYG